MSAIYKDSPDGTMGPRHRRLALSSPRRRHTGSRKMICPEQGRVLHQHLDVLVIRPLHVPKGRYVDQLQRQWLVRLYISFRGQGRLFALIYLSVKRRLLYHPESEAPATLLLLPSVEDTAEIHRPQLHGLASPRRIRCISSSTPLLARLTGESWEHCLGFGPRVLAEVFVVQHLPSAWSLGWVET